ncbi:hypothetical protein LEN26_001821 [Aphanomyces euteiches]|nr:hypothetical protein LEN26_001821 [Aphanomyces euteiches]
MQGIVDSNLFFMEFSVRPGGCNDKTLWSKSPIGINPRTYIPTDCHVLGDSGYNLREFLLTPYQHDQILNRHQRAYNKYHSKTRNPVERAFGALKSRFLILKTEMDMNTIAEVGIIIAACVVLHNWCLRHESDALSTLDEIIPMDNEKFENNPNDVMLDHTNDIENNDPPDTEASAFRHGVKKRNEFVRALAAARNLRDNK